jgi:tRNA (cytidine/uridine-2'-O-)-methyltransferase
MADAVESPHEIQMPGGSAEFTVCDHMIAQLFDLAHKLCHCAGQDRTGYLPATGTSLHLIEPLGFRLNEKEIKRAGMDYWQHLDVTRYMNFQEFWEMHPGAKIWMATTKAHQTYTDVKFGPDDYIMFGKESAGIPEEILVEHEETCIRIPMLPEIRSLNLSNSVAIVLYEALRQQGFASMQRDGELHRLHWKDQDEQKDQQ